MPVLTTCDLDACLSFAEEIASWAIDRIGTERPPTNEVATKDGPMDFVTATDRAVEQHVRGLLHARFPDHQVIGEEFGAGGGDPGDLVWYVDPVDGTANYVHGLPFAAFSLALADENGTAVGVIADPYRGEIFSAARGRGARLNDRPVARSDRVSLGGALVLTEWSSLPWTSMARMQHALAGKGCAVRILGSTALTLAHTATGRAAATLLGEYNPWDVLAGVLIAREAGMSVLAVAEGGRPVPEDEPLPDEGLLVAAPGVAEEIYRLWSFSV